MPRRYSSADLAASLQKSGLPVEFKYRANPKKSSGPSESEIQQQVVDWWNRYGSLQFGEPKEMLMAMPLQALRTPRNGAKMKREGVRSGTPDMLLGIPTLTKPGLWIEMKKPGGEVSDVQRLMLDLLAGQGYATAICWSFEAAKSAIEEYLSPA